MAELVGECFLKFFKWVNLKLPKLYLFSLTSLPCRHRNPCLRRPELRSAQLHRLRTHIAAPAPAPYSPFSPSQAGQSFKKENPFHLVPQPPPLRIEKYRLVVAKQSQGWKAQHREHSQQHCDNCVRCQVSTRNIRGTLCKVRGLFRRYPAM